MTKIDIISGFLGAGKTTLIKKLLDESFKGEKLVLIENEFGEIAIDGGFLKDAGVQINEINAGCICCSLVGQFDEALKEMVETYAPDRVIIEPSGVGKLSDVSRAVGIANQSVPMELGCAVAVVDAKRCKTFLKNFGEFFVDQIRTAGTIILSRTQGMDEAKLDAVIELIRGENADATIITTPWDEISGDTILAAMNHHSMAETLMEEARQQAEELAHKHEHDHEHHHHHDHDEDCECGCHDHEHHHHHDHDDECECGCHDHEHHHHHDHDEDCECGCHDHEHHHHHHDHDEDCECGCHDHEHHHHHDHDEDCECGCHDHDHHHHHADEVFVSWGIETPHKFTVEELENALTALDTGKYGQVLRAKGIVNTVDGKWVQFDMVPEEHEIREGSADYTGRICVIGAELKESELPGLFGI